MQINHWDEVVVTNDLQMDEDEEDDTRLNQSGAERGILLEQRKDKRDDGRGEENQHELVLELLEDELPERRGRLLRQRVGSILGTALLDLGVGETLGRIDVELGERLVDALCPCCVHGGGYEGVDSHRDLLWFVMLARPMSKILQQSRKATDERRGGWKGRWRGEKGKGEREDTHGRLRRQRGAGSAFEVESQSCRGEGGRTVFTAQSAALSFSTVGFGESEGFANSLRVTFFSLFFIFSTRRRVCRCLAVPLFPFLPLLILSNQVQKAV